VCSGPAYVEDALARDGCEYLGPTDRGGKGHDIIGKVSLLRYYVQIISDLHYGRTVRHRQPGLYAADMLKNVVKAFNLVK
jgi:hypothetical protein